MLGLKLLESLYGLLVCDQFGFVAFQSQIAFSPIVLDGRGVFEQCVTELLSSAQMFHGNHTQARLLAQTIELGDASLDLLQLSIAIAEFSANGFDVSRCKVP